MRWSVGGGGMATLVELQDAARAYIQAHGGAVTIFRQKPAGT